MGNLRICRRPFTKQKDASTVVGRVKPNGGCCKKHPKHQQSPGVCSLCLKEKLAKLPAAFSHRRRVTTSLCSSYTSSSSVSSLSSYYDSLCSSSSCPSPVHCGSSSGLIFPVLFKHGIMRRKSMSTVATQARKRDHHDEDYEGGVRGFWFNFLHPKRKIGKDKRDTNNKMHCSMFYKSKGLHNQLKP